VGARLAIQADIVESVNLLSVRPRLKDCGGDGGRDCGGGRWRNCGGGGVAVVGLQARLVAKMPPNEIFALKSYNLRHFRVLIFFCKNA